MARTAAQRREVTLRRFHEKIERVPGVDCWLWNGCVNEWGYGSFKFDLKTHLAHRAAYQFFRGAIPPNRLVCHRCDTPSCVNPDHLWIGTDAENHRDMVDKGRSNRAKGESHGNARLTNQRALEIFNSPLPALSLAVLHGVGPGTVNRIRRGQAYASVTGKIYRRTRRPYNLTAFADALDYLGGVPA